MRNTIKLLRLKHHIKNLLMFAPLLFSGQLLQPTLFLRTCVGFFAFSAAASAVYVFNDLRDARRDRLHSTKKNRPLASGAVSRRAAWLLFGGLLALCAVLLYLSAEHPLSYVFVAVYLLINIGYSLGLKHVPILDISILSAGYVLRVLYGSSLTGITISSWLYLTVIALSFFLSLGKRRNELMQQGDDTRRVLQFYNKDFLDKFMYLCLALTIAFYSLWSVDPLTLARLSNPYLIWTVPLVIVICMKYSLNIEGHSDGDPIEVVLHDKLLLALIAVFGLAVSGMVYL